MDETDLLVSTLETKADTIENEVIQVAADLNAVVKFSENLDCEERLAELEARKKVVKGYVKRARNRLVKLRERYKELIVRGKGGRGYDSAGRGARSTSSNVGGTSSSGGGASYGSGGSGTVALLPIPGPVIHRQRH